MLCKSVQELLDLCQDVLEISTDHVQVKDPVRLRKDLIDKLVYNGVVAENTDIKELAFWLVWETGRALNIKSSSIQGLYEARCRNEYNGKTIPAINIRGLTYDVARAILRSALRNKVGAVLFEIARSEITYTFQRPKEYSLNCIAAAIKEGWEGPVFIQGDHFQINHKKYEEDSEKEVNIVKALIDEAVEAGFYNIDIDTSTLVDLTRATVKEQQELNYVLCANLTKYIRDREPKGITISVGGEIGEVGEKNSTEEELRAFMDGYLETLKKQGNYKGISKVSIQTGTSHGGVPLPDGKVADVKLDFGTLERLSKVARQDYGISGAVQHGASTLPDDAFHRFPETETAEVHLATGFQNMLYESPHLPVDLKNKIFEHLQSHFISEKKDSDTMEQFLYKTRKKGFGPFKKELLDLPEETKENIRKELEAKFDFLFNKLDVMNTKDLVNKTVKLVDVPKKRP